MTLEKSFHFGLEIVKAETPDDGDWIFEGMASLPGRDIQGEEVFPGGLEIDYLLGKGLPDGAGGFINLEHDPNTIVGIPLEGKVTPQGFWLKWKALKTPLMRKIVEQMKALKEAGWPRRYGMSIEGVVKQYDPKDPTRILKAFIRNVALTLTPVHPATFVDFAKSLSASTVLEYQPMSQRKQAIAEWADTVTAIHGGQVVMKSTNPYFHEDGTFKRDMDVQYFMDVHGLPENQAVWCARYALSREPLVLKSLDDKLSQLHQRSRGHPKDILRDHLREHKRNNPGCPHITKDGHINGGLREAARHFYGCEHRQGMEVNAILDLLKGSGLLEREG